MSIAVLAKGREKSVLRHHPWIFSNAIATIKETPVSGGTIDVISARGELLACGAYSPLSQIRIRIWTFDAATAIDAQFFKATLQRAIERRRALAGGRLPSAIRLVNAESDGLPGLVVDKYGDFLVCQFTAVGVEFWKTVIVAALAELFPVTGIFERSDSAVRQKEGLVPQTGILKGPAPPDRIEIDEDGKTFSVDIKNGHKTGWYLDQTLNRAIVGRLAMGRTVLNCFAYTGGFAVAALAGGARHATNIDTSRESLDLARRNLLQNGFSPADFENEAADVFTSLRRYRDSRRTFDLIVLDPPKFVESRNQVDKGAKAYKDINLLAFKLLNPGGLLATFSCSGHIPAALFQKITADAALDAGVNAAIIHHLGPGPDHPIGLAFPEGAYLKGLVCQI